MLNLLFLSLGSLSLLATHKRKLNNLNVNNDLCPCDPYSVVFNYSSITLPKRIKTLLALGWFLSTYSQTQLYKFFPKVRDVNKINELISDRTKFEL